MSASAIPLPDFAEDVGYGDSDELGRHVVDMAVRAGLTSEDRMLDIGCGWGRVARVLTEVIRPPGSYDGLDVRQDFIDWAGEEISRRHPHFRFEHAPIRNSAYNPRGKGDAAKFRFPYADGAFTFALAASLFTHLTAPALVNYTRELARVLTPGGTGLLTYLLIDEQSMEAVSEGRAGEYSLVRSDGAMWLRDPKIPEVTVAYDEPYVLRTLRESDLEPARVEHGFWAGRPPEDCWTHQDVVVVRRASTRSTGR